MNGPNDINEDHGWQEPHHSQRREETGEVRCGLGAASALARFKSQKQERQLLADPEGSSGGPSE